MLFLRHQVGLLVCFVECLLFGGTLYGWPSLVYVLKDDRVYAHLCRPVGAAQQQQQQPPQAHNESGNAALPAGHTSPMDKASAINMSANVTATFTIPPAHIWNGSKSTSKEIRSHVAGGLPGGAPGCPEQDTHLALAVILAVLTQGLSALPAGRIFDRFGLRVTRSMASVFGFVGYSVLAFVQEGATSWLVYPGCVCIGIAQNIIMMTNCYVTELAGSRASTLVALYNGAMLASSGILLTVKIGHDHGILRTTSMTILGGLWIITIVNTFTFLPKRKILRAATRCATPSSPDTEQSSAATPYVPNDSPDGNDQVSDDVSSNYVPAYELAWTRGLLASEPIETEYEMVDLNQESGSAPNKPRDDPRPWIAHVKSSLFVSYLYWFCSLHFRINVFISTFSLWVAMVVEEDKSKESYFTDVYGYLNIAGIILSPIPGLLIDYRRKKLAVHERFGLLGAMASAPALTFATSVALVMSLTSLLKHEVAIYTSTILCVVLRAFVYPTGTAFIGLVWPSRVYGTLFGVTFTMLGAVAFLQYPFVIWASTLHRGNISMNALLLFLTVLSFLLPGHILFKYKKRKETHDTSTTSHATLTT